MLPHATPLPAPAGTTGQIRTYTLCILIEESSFHHTSKPWCAIQTLDLTISCINCILYILVRLLIICYGMSAQFTWSLLLKSGMLLNLLRQSIQEYDGEERRERERTPVHCSLGWDDASSCSLVAATKEETENLPVAILGRKTCC